MGKSKVRRTKGQRRARQRAAAANGGDTRDNGASVGAPRGADVRRSALRENARKETVAVVKALQSADVQQRIQALIALASTFEAGPEKAQEQSEAFQVLFMSGALPVFVARLADTDPTVRHLASGILCNMCSAGASEVSTRLVNAGIHTGALELAKRAIPATSEYTQDLMQTRIRALDLLTELCVSSAAALRALEDLDGSTFVSMAALLETTSETEPALAMETVEHSARLLNVALESNPVLAQCVFKNEAARSTLTRFCASPAVSVPEGILPEGTDVNALKLTHARAAMHAASALMSVASTSAEAAQTLDLSQVFARLLSLANETLNFDAVDPEAASLVLEVVASSCAVSNEGENEDGDSPALRNEKALRRACADQTSQNEIAQRCAHIISSSQESLNSPVAQELAPRACGLLDNLVQNASVEQVVVLDPQGMWNATFAVFEAILKTMASEGDNAVAALEDFITMMTAFQWSLIRRVIQIQDESNKMSRGALSLDISPAQLALLLDARDSGIPPHARVNIVGMLGVLGATFNRWDSETLSKIGSGLLNSVVDASIFVAIQAIDSSIDMFSADELHDLFMNLKGLEVLKSAIPRLKLCLDDQDSRIDRQNVDLVKTNAEDFVEYKRDFIRQRR